MSHLTETHPQDAEHDERPIRAGVYSHVRDADRAVSNLLAAGFTTQEISVMCSDEAIERHFQQFEHEQPAGTHTPASAAIGTVVGAAVGGLVAVTGLITTGGAAVLAAGAVATWAGGIVGGFVGAMMTRGVEKSLANFYDQALTAGKILVAVHDEGEHATSRLAQAEKILVDAGSEPITLPEG
jgi:uncharacterized membrane protein YphA (DoxX/SURF4 family)